MRTLSSLLIVILAACAAFSQKSNDAVKKQIRDRKADNITLTFDGGSKTSKLMAAAPNFSDSEAKAAGIQAMNFGMAAFYTGTAIATPCDPINFTFWVMSKKPRYAGGAKWIFGSGADAIDLGDARYANKPTDDMEYLNFKISRADLTKIADSSSPEFRLGSDTFTFTPEQVRMLKDLLAISDSK